MRGGHKVARGPYLQHVSEVYDETIGAGSGRNPRSINLPDLQSSNTILCEDSQTAEIRVFSDPLYDPGISLNRRVGDETKHTVGRRKVTGKRVFFDAKAKGETPDKIFSNEAEFFQIALTYLLESWAVCRPLVRALKSVVALVGI